MAKRRIMGFIAIAALIAIGAFSTFAQAEMKSNSYKITSSVMSSTGGEKTSEFGNYSLLDVVGQPTPIGISDSNNFEMKAGFLYDLQFSLSPGDAAGNVIEALKDILADPTISLSKQEDKNVDQAIKFLNDALDALDVYESGDAAALANALNKIKSAINKLVAVDSVDTAVYQKMLAEAAEIAVTSEVNTIAATVGDSNPFIVQAREFLTEGNDEILTAFYNGAVQSFVQAYNEALLAA